MTEARSIAACPQCQVHWYLGEPAKCSDPGHEHQVFEVHRHRSVVVLPDGTEVMAVSFDAADPYGRDVPLSTGCTWTRDGSPHGPTTTLTGLISASRFDPVQLLAGLGHVLQRASAGQRVEIGCLGGQGRTGTALACLAVISGIAPGDAVAWARANYCAEAVETADQEAFLAKLEH